MILAKRLDMRSKYVPNKDIMFSTSSFRSLHRKNKRKTKSRGPRFFRAAVAAVLSQLKIRAFYLLYEVKAEKKKEGPLLRGIYYKKGLSHTIWDHTVPPHRVIHELLVITYVCIARIFLLLRILPRIVPT